MESFTKNAEQHLNQLVQHYGHKVKNLLESVHQVVMETLSVRLTSLVEIHYNMGYRFQMTESILILIFNLELQTLITLANQS